MPLDEHKVAPDPATLRSGVSGIALYFMGKMLYVTNVGKTFSVVSRPGVARAVLRPHHPFDWAETARTWVAEGWVSTIHTHSDISIPCDQRLPGPGHIRADISSRL